MSAVDLILGAGEQDWRDFAVCAQVDPDAWFPEKGGATREAKRICLGCPVRARHLGGTGECLDYALAHQERFGIWGGVSERERRMMDPPSKQDRSKRCRNGHDVTQLGRTAGGRCRGCQLDNQRRNHERRMRLQRERREDSA